MKKLLLCIPLASCASLPNPSTLLSREANPAKAELEFSTDGVSFRGVAVVKHKTPRAFKVNIPKDARELYVTTCHRVEKYISPKTPFEYNYVPRPLVENVGSCMLKFEVIDKDGLYHSAVVDFVDKEDLRAFSNCNGQIYDRTGGELCQAPIGLKQMLQVTEDVDVASLERCSTLSCTSHWCYYNISEGYCVYALKSLETGKRFRLTTRGFRATAPTPEVPK